MSENDIWHRDALPPDARETLDVLSRHHALDPFYLAGGTALALQYGHRSSVDLDFFSNNAFEEDTLLGKLQDLPATTVISKSPETLHLHVGSTKVTFVGYHYPSLFPFLMHESMKIADPRDIAAMKLSAIASRGARRDFIDLYVLSQRYGLDEIIRNFQQKYSHTTYSDIHLMKSLTYFADAEKEPMPHMIEPITWAQVKEFFVIHAPRLRR